MPSTGRLDLEAPRWAPFIYTILFEGADFSGDTLRMQVRATPDAEGDPLIDLILATAGTQGLSYTTAIVDGGVDSTLTIQIDKSTMSGLPYPGSHGERGDDLVLYWDLHRDPNDAAEYVALEGQFTVKAGVTRYA